MNESARGLFDAARITGEIGFRPNAQYSRVLIGTRRERAASERPSSGRSTDLKVREDSSTRLGSLEKSASGRTPSIRESLSERAGRGLPPRDRTAEVLVARPLR